MSIKSKEPEITTQGNLLLGIVVLFTALIIVGLIGLLALRPEKIEIIGEAEASEYRVSGKLPGRVDLFLAEEGDFVQRGDTIVIIQSPEVEAKMAQALAIHGAREEQIEGAYELYQKALAGEEIYKKSYQRIKNLYEKGVVSAQKHDEVYAQYQAAKATTRAAKSQYQMALNGAQDEDKKAAKAMVERVDATIKELDSYMSERYLTSPIDGEVSECFPKRGELVGQGAPIMSIVDLSDMWFHFSIREDMLNGITKGTIVYVNIPAINDTATFATEVTYIKVMASYATWRSTQTNGGYDIKTFDVKTRPIEPIKNVRPGMTAIVKKIG